MSRINIIIPDELHKSLKMKSAEEGITLTQKIIDSLEKEVRCNK